MKRSGVVKFPNSLQLYKFCQKVLSDLRGEKINDQEVGAILDFNPSDCSHWKRGEKNVKSVFALTKLAESLKLEISLIYDLASGHSTLDEAYFEYQEARNFQDSYAKAKLQPTEQFNKHRQLSLDFAQSLVKKADFSTPPLYLPEIFRLFAFINVAPTELIDKLTRILRTKPHHYTLQFKKGELKSQTRLSMVLDLAKIIFEAERSSFPELGPVVPEFLAFEKMMFASELLIPKQALNMELAKLDARKNVVAELSTLFWVPKSLVGFKLQESIRDDMRSSNVLDAQRSTNTNKIVSEDKSSSLQF